MSKNSITLTCTLCQGSYSGRQVRKVNYCPRCKYKGNRLAKAKKRKSAPIERTSGSRKIRSEAEAMKIRECGMYVVSDPLGAGGFADGAYFGRLEWIAMVKHCTFTPGNVLRGVSGNMYVIPEIASRTTEMANE